MPADADLLCEYYISSNLKKKTTIASSVAKPSVSSIDTGDYLISASATSQLVDSTIDFVKYDKNPMDYLKSKYQLLSSSSCINALTSSTTISSSSMTTKITSTNTTTMTSQSEHTASLNNNGQVHKSNGLKNSSEQWLELNWSKIKKTGIGLYNLGNNCYLNATLQCLAYTPPLSQWLIARPHSPACKFKQMKGFCSLCEVERIIFDIFNSSNGCAKPNNLCFNIKKISNVFGVGSQEDASEFFTTLLESMAKSIKFALNPSSNGFKNHMPNHIHNHQQPSTNGTGKKKITTILDDIFSFQFRSRITCSNCSRVSDTVENTNTWPVDVKYVQDIRKGMLHFLREEVLDGENAYKCDKCNRKTRATKKYSIRTAPNILVIHLKRFDYSYGGKLSHFVQYPEQISLKTFIPEPSTGSCNGTNAELRNITYKLYGVLVHLGYTSHSGHYYSYVRGPNEAWFKADDQRISRVQERDALAQNAYILFYSRVYSPNQSPSPPAQQVTTSSLVNSPLFTNTFKPATNVLPHQTLVTKSSSNLPTIIRDETPKASTSSTSSYLNSLNTTKTSNGLSSTSGSTTNNIILKLKTAATNDDQSKQEALETKSEIVPLKFADKPVTEKKSKLAKYKSKIKKLKESLKLSNLLEVKERKKKRKLLIKFRKLLKIEKEAKQVKNNDEKEKKEEDESKKEVIEKKPVILDVVDTKKHNEMKNEAIKRKNREEDDNDGHDNNESFERKKMKKNKHKQSSMTSSDGAQNSLALLQQYNSSPSPSPSPSSSSSYSSLSTMSSASSSSSLSSSSKKKQNSTAEPIVKDSSESSIYKYTSSSKLSISNEPSSTVKPSHQPNAIETLANKEASSIKTWNNKESSLVSIDRSQVDYDEDDLFNEEFDEAKKKSSTHRFNSNQAKNPNFHAFTYQTNNTMASNGNHQSYNNNNNNSRNGSYFNNSNNKFQFKWKSQNNNNNHNGNRSNWNGHNNNNNNNNNNNRRFNQNGSNNNYNHHNHNHNTNTNNHYQHHNYHHHKNGYHHHQKPYNVFNRR